MAHSGTFPRRKRMPPLPPLPPPTARRNASPSVRLVVVPKEGPTMPLSAGYAEAETEGTPLPLPPIPTVPRRAPPPPPLDEGARTVLDEPLPVLAGEEPLPVLTGNGFTRLLGKMQAARGPAREKLVRTIEHLRLLYRLKVLVQIEHLKQKKHLNQAKLNKWVVSTYKAMGFTVLTVIVLALVSYLGANLFYWVSSSWIVPTVISPTDERVLALSAQLAQQASQRDRLKADLADADRTVAMQQDFLRDAQQALEDELTDRKNELRKLYELGRSYATTRAQVHRTSSVYSGMSRRRLSAEYQARIIDHEQAVSGAFQLSQIAQGKLSLDERGVELDKRTRELQRETEALSAIVAKKSGAGRSYEVLRILQDLKHAELELAKARDNRTALAASLQRYEKIVATISESPYLKAVDQKAAIAYVPYDNVDRVKVGAPLYTCSLGLFWCKKAGTIKVVLSGEVSLKHPLHNQMLRGQAVELELADARLAERKVMFVGGRPILF